MSIKYFFLIFVLLLLTVLSLMTYLLASTGSLFFYLLEGSILVTFIFLIVFYRKIVKPLHSIGTGMDLLREQDFSSRLSPVGQYEADRIVNIFNHMMEQLKNERIRMREQNHFLDLLIKASPMGVVILDLDGKVDSLNPAALRIFALPPEKILGYRLQDLDLPLAEELAKISLNRVQTVRLSDSNIYKCSHSSFVDRGFQRSFLLVEGLTHEVFKAEKKAYEKVIRMIAHEVNNTTAGITSTLDTVEGALREVDHTEEIREVMQVCIERCYSMSRFIIRFADVVKIPTPVLLPTDLNGLVHSCKRFMETICTSRSIHIHLELSEKPVNVNLDSALFEQVLVNIIKNAAESIDSNGDIYIRTTANPKMLEVADTGQGISKEMGAKVFTPFFSTKPNGQGIGLIFIREVLTKHNCSFSLRTYPDGLTRFRIQYE